ncbi:MAG: alpha/beta hydrolase [Actinomycetota bacterium]|nr:alpha/beta hydrolase [Actinomycetota bacterium]
MAISGSLGRPREVELDGGGTIRYRERGDGEPVVFAHGLLVNGDLWRNVVPAIAGAGYRCITPDLPLGSHEPAMRPSADLSTPALAALLGGFIDAVGARGGTLVANDTGGALSQVLVTTRPEIVGRLALTSCDAFDIYPPHLFKAFRLVAGYVPGAPFVLAQLARLRPLQRSPAAFGWVAKRPIEPAIVQSYTRPARESAAVRRDVVKILRGISSRYTEAAAGKLPDFGKPAIVLWAAEDKLFPTAYGRRLADCLSAEYVEIPDSHTFIAEDQPQALADELLRFLHADRR